MHFTTISAVACFVALASASNHGHHFHMRRQLNATVPSTTLTVYATKTVTTLSCAAIVTDCPNRPEMATSEVILTETIIVATTICPVADASSISSAIASGILPSTTPAVPIAPLSTGSPVITSAPAQEASTSDTVLTYTLGTGTRTTVVTTVIKHTQTKTVYATSTVSTPGETDETSEEAETTGKAGEFFEASPSSTGDQAGVGIEPTTTITSSRTMTKYVTVYPAPSAGSDVAGSAGCEAVAPVTVTVALSTITVATTVTETAAATCPTAEGSVEVAAATSTQDGIVASPLPTDEASVVPITRTLIPVPVSTGAPYGNGTSPSNVSSGAAAPTAVLPIGGSEYKRSA